jgi:hypothetical protein
MAAPFQKPDAEETIFGVRLAPTVVRAFARLHPIDQVAHVGAPGLPTPVRSGTFSPENEAI